jgi:hypothetical protein
MKHYKDTNGDLFAYEEDGSQDHLIPANYVAITEAQFKSLTDYVSTYKDKRYDDYHDLREQLDMLYWDQKNGTTNWQDHITEIKNKHPKS